jgi:hypothetical protein
VVQVHVPPPGFSCLWPYQVVLAGPATTYHEASSPDLLVVGMGSWIIP